MNQPHGHDHEDQDEPGQPEPDDGHGHHRPSLADQQATLAAYRAILTGASFEVQHHAAASGDCHICTAVSAAAFGITAAEQLAAQLVARLAPGAMLDIGPIRAAILDVIDSAEAELRSGLN